MIIKKVEAEKMEEEAEKMEEKYKNVIRIAFVGLLLFLPIATASASIEMTDIGIQYDMIEHYGYVDYQNTANHNVSGAILVFIDGDLVAGKIVDMPIRYVAGFRCSPTKTLEFPLKTTKGDHTIVAYVISQNITAQRGYEYTMDGWEEGEVEEKTEIEEEGTNVKDWLPCCGGIKNGDKKCDKKAMISRLKRL
jgi:hypothetical protein